MPSLTPQGAKIRALRKSLGLTQLELALAAGVSDRTVRNAETNLPIRHNFLEFIAGALGVNLSDVAEISHELVQHQRWRSNCAVFLAGVQRSLIGRDPRGLLDVSHSDFNLYMFGMLPNVPSIDPLLGSFIGSDGTRRFVDNAASFWEMDPGGVFIIKEPFGSGDTVVVRGLHELWQRDGGVTWGDVTFVAEFDAGRIRTCQGSIVPTQPPTGIKGMLSPQVSTPEPTAAPVDARDSQPDTY